jgi:hypothetical protein
VCVSFEACYNYHSIISTSLDNFFLSSIIKLREKLATHKIALIEKKTSKAIEVFNKLFQEGRKVAEGFHITC